RDMDLAVLPLSHRVSAHVLVSTHLRVDVQLYSQSGWLILISLMRIASSLLQVLGVQGTSFAPPPRLSELCHGILFIHTLDRWIHPVPAARGIHTSTPGLLGRTLRISAGAAKLPRDYYY